VPSARPLVFLTSFARAVRLRCGLTPITKPGSQPWRDGRSERGAFSRTKPSISSGPARLPGKPVDYAKPAFARLRSNDAGVPASYVRSSAEPAFSGRRLFGPLPPLPIRGAGTQATYPSPRLCWILRREWLF